MSVSLQSLIHFKDIQPNGLRSIFDRALLFQQRDEAKKPLISPLKRPPLVGLLFFEPSTRTRVSFEVACKKLGINSFVMESGGGSSLIKGETLWDTVLNVSAMNPDLLVVRASEQLNLDEVAEVTRCPIINGGSGGNSHLTQGLLDAYTVERERGQLSGERVLIVGDIRHSRVAQSNLEILPSQGAEVAICCPDNFVPKNWQGQRFKSLAEGMKWATVAMALRVQKERHEEKEWALEEYIHRYQINGKALEQFSPEGIVLAPGPVNHGVDISSEVFKDSRCRIFHQVQYGVYIRCAILTRMLDLEEG